MNILSWIITIILNLIGIYMFFMNSKRYNDYRKKMKVYLDNHKDAQKFDNSKGTIILEIILIVVCFILAVVLPASAATMSERYGTMLLYTAIIFLAASMVMETYTTKKIFFSQDTFFYDQEAYKYKLITKIVPASGLFKPAVVSFGSKEISVSKKVAAKLEEQYKQWKAARKTTRREKRGRR